MEIYFFTYCSVWHSSCPFIHFTMFAGGASCPSLQVDLASLVRASKRCYTYHMCRQWQCCPRRYCKCKYFAALMFCLREDNLWTWWFALCAKREGKIVVVMRLLPPIELWFLAEPPAVRTNLNLPGVRSFLGEYTMHAVRLLVTSLVVLCCRRPAVSLTTRSRTRWASRTPTWPR